MKERLKFDANKHIKELVEAMKKGLKEKFEKENKELDEKDALENSQRKVNQNNNLSNSDTERERERRESKGDLSPPEREFQPNSNSTTPTNSESNPLPQISSFFTQLLTQIPNNSPQYSELKKEQEQTLTILSKSSESEQIKYLSLINKMQELMEKNKIANSENTQKEIIRTGEEMDKLVKELEGRQKEEMKIEQKQSNNLILGIGLGVFGGGLIIGIIAYLITKSRNKRIEE